VFYTGSEETTAGIRQETNSIRYKIRSLRANYSGSPKHLITWSHFPNILHAAFTRKDPKSTKNAVKLSVFFALLGSASVKMGVKFWEIDHWSQFHQHFMNSFFKRKCFCSFSLIFWWKNIGKKQLIKCWWSQFNVHFMSSFYAKILSKKNKTGLRPVSRQQQDRFTNML